MLEREIPSRSASLQIAHGNPRKTLMLMLKREFGAEYFVETGTHHGRTALWASQHFERIYTVEGFQELYEQTSQKLAGVKNIEFFLGNSREQLESIVARVDAPAIFWLDAHWMGDDTTYGEDECPILGEIDVINSSNLEHFVFIDDARLFLSPPPKPLSIEGWPNIDAVLQELRRRDRYIVVIDDTIIAVPRFAESFTADYCQHVNTIALAIIRKEKNRLINRARKRSRRALYSCLLGVRAFLGMERSKKLPADNSGQART